MMMKPTQKYPDLISIMAMTLSVLLLQVGVSYYISFQTVALLMIFFIIIRGGGTPVNFAYVFVILCIFCWFLTLTALNVHIAISENSVNILNTFIGIVAYTLMILMAINLSFKQPERTLRFFGSVSSLTISLIVFLIILTDLSVVPFLTRENLVLQNITLITNNTSLEAVTDSFSALENAGMKPDMDLFYGEQSFLAIVLFACVTCKMVCSQLLDYYSPLLNSTASKNIFKRSIARLGSPRAAIIMGLATMIYIKSFSSVFYVAIICVSLAISNRQKILRGKLGVKGILAILVGIVVIGLVAWSSFDYYMNRVTNVSDSGSFEQRFASINDFSWQDYFLGIDDALKIPETGFHNGILYIIAISGFGGLSFIFLLLFRVYLLARRIDLSIITIFCVLGIFSQNGGIFSPNKVVILSFVLIPLSCARRLKVDVTQLKTSIVPV